MQTRNEIITNLYHCKKFNGCINKMQPEHLREDLKSEVLLIVIQHPKLLEMEGVSFFAIRVALNLIKSSSSPFSKMYRTPVTDIIPEDATPEDEKEPDPEKTLDLINRIKSLAYQSNPEYIDLPGISWYKQYLVSLYLKLGSYRAIEKETKIPYFAARSTIVQAIIDLRKYATTV